MRTEIVQAIEAVEEINERLANYDPECPKLTVTSDGYVTQVTFMDEVLWQSEDDDRHFDEDTKTYESMLTYLEKQLSAMAEELPKVFEAALKPV